MTECSNTGLWMRLVVPFVCFTVAGSIALALFLQAAYRRNSREVFETLAQTNAEFIKAAHIPPTDRFAGYLSRVLNMRVYFQPVSAPPLTAGHGEEAISCPVSDSMDLVLVRPVSDTAILLWQPTTLGVLGGFWVLSFGLAWVVGRAYLKTQRLAMLGRMATSLAHEIQNPVAAIRLHAQLADHHTILNEAATIESLVNQWQFLARPQPPQKSTVNLRDLVTGMTEALAPLAAHARVRLTAPVPADLSVMADRRRLTQAVNNLVLNAIQSLPQGGAVTITATGVDGHVHLQVADTGAGFSAAALARCPELFYSEKEGGMGIGLAVTHEIVKAHGGTLTLRNAPTGGAVATLVWPEGQR